MRFLSTTKSWGSWWARRKIDWKKSYSDTWTHPHRTLIVNVLKNLKWLSLFEVGCGSAPNIRRIIEDFPNVQLGGSDVNPEAIALASKTFTGGLFKVGSSDDVMLSDKSTDICLSDMSLIYVSPRDIDRYVREMKRVARNYVILCEFHSNSWWDRFMLKMKEGYFAYDWDKVLTRNGFCDIMKYRMTKQNWPESTLQQTFGHIILARVPKR